MNAYDAGEPTTETTPPPPPPEPDEPRPHRTSGRHPVNIGHLVMGLVFLTFVGIWGLIQADVVDGGDIRFLLPVPWVLGGAVGLIVALVGAARRRRG